MGVNFLERQVLRRGHVLQRVFIGNDYGTDAQMHHFSPVTGEIENGRVEFQVKATDTPKFVHGDKSIACTVETADINHWYWEVAHPFILVLYDARKHRAFWVDVQAYVDEQHGIAKDRRTLTVRIPTSNRLTLGAVDRFRTMSLDRIRQLTQRSVTDG